MVTYQVLLPKNSSHVSAWHLATPAALSVVCKYKRKAQKMQVYNHTLNTSDKSLLDYKYLGAFIILLAFTVRSPWFLKANLIKTSNTAWNLQFWHKSRLNRKRNETWVLVFLVVFFFLPVSKKLPGKRHAGAALTNPQVPAALRTRGEAQAFSAGPGSWRCLKCVLIFN